ncbi:sulfide:quinone oxidoreductase, mitochondrial [Condylostylus longicornis]|uniref:sulfide:quinone oxidoreductase, mitochondrial n=1 Tax=Condylostylus longicornis TaxID=2530218 RepID=UPI00244DEA06|nr:sulfide:quinone oxidoreductase, mitochondrial [Condylostylus longicornis]
MIFNLLSGGLKVKFKKIVVFDSNTIRLLSTSNKLHNKERCKVLVVGGGTGGCAAAAKLSHRLPKNQVMLVEPADKHYYQPMFTLIGGGMKNLDSSWKYMKKILPEKAKWIQEKVVKFEPSNNIVVTNTNKEIEYDILLIAMGLQLNYNKVPGLVEALSIPDGNVTSIYSPKYVNRHWEALQKFQSGNIIFTFPNSPVKCPGAPQKIVYITEEYLRKHNKRQNSTVTYMTSLPVIFGVKPYADALWEVVKKRDINVTLRKNLCEVKPEQNVAVFQDLDNLTKFIELEYSLLHAVPPMSAPLELAQSTELVNEAGFVDVHPSTMQHKKYNNIFAIGDCSASPNSKTAAAAAAQTPVVVDHIMAIINGKKLERVYDGYASCPLVTGYSKCILAEFDYDLKPKETFPFDQRKERYSMFIMKKDFMPLLYWHLMLNGYWNGPDTMRNLLNIFSFGKKKY